MDLMSFYCPNIDNATRNEFIQQLEMFLVQSGVIDSLLTIGDI